MLTYSRRGREKNKFGVHVSVKVRVCRLESAQAGRSRPRKIKIHHVMHIRLPSLGTFYGPV